jgi:hypothetical protein
MARPIALRAQNRPFSSITARSACITVRVDSFSTNCP